MNHVEFSVSQPNQSDAGSNEERSLTAGCANEVVEYKYYLRGFRNINRSRVSITGVAFVS
jgi:hypothetical protein